MRKQNVPELVSGEIQSTYLLPDKDVVDYLWLIFERKTGYIPEESASENGDAGKVQGNDELSYELAQNIILEHRMKVMLCAKTEGESLVECSSSWELCETIAHCLLGVFVALYSDT